MGSVVVTNLEHGSFYCSRLAASVHIDLAGFCVSLFILNQIDSALLLFVCRTPVAGSHRLINGLP